MLGNPLWIFGAVCSHPLTVYSVSLTSVGRVMSSLPSWLFQRQPEKKKTASGSGWRKYENLIVTKIDASIHHLKVLWRKLNLVATQCPHVLVCLFILHNWSYCSLMQRGSLNAEWAVSRQQVQLFH